MYANLLNPLFIYFQWLLQIFCIMNLLNPIDFAVLAYIFVQINTSASLINRQEWQNFLFIIS